MFISLCMIVKDENENIKNCLDKAMELVDEAIVVDTGSTDGTLEILNNYNNNKIKIIKHKWNNDFSDARNKSIEFAKGDYILILDADERIFCDREKLEEFLKSKNALAYKIPIYNIFENKEIQITAEMIRLYKNQNPMYEGAIHEQITFNGEKNLGVVIDADICKIYHYGYSKIVFSEKDKQKRNMDIILSEINKNPKDSFNWYNKGVMEMIAGDYDSALDDFIKSHKLAKNKRMAFHNDLIIKMIQCLLMQKKYKNAIEFMNPLLKDVYINTLPDLYYYLGLAYKELENYKMAERNFLRAIKIGDASQKNSKFGIGSYMPLVELARIQVKKKNIDNAIEKYREAILHKNNLNKYGLDEYKQFLKEADKELLINEFDDTELDFDSNTNNSSENNNKMNEYKAKFKENIEQLIESGMIEEAETLIDEYDSMFNQEPMTFSLRGIISTIKGNNNLAISYFQKGLEIENTNFDLLFNLGYVYKNIGDMPKAIEYFTKAIQIAETIELEDEAYSMLIELGIDKTKREIKNRLLKEIDNENENINDMNILKQEFKKNIETLLSQGLIIEAKELFSEYEKISSNDIDIYSIKGIIAIMEGDIGKAERILKEGLLLESDNFDLNYNLGYLYQSKNMTNSAIKYYKKALINVKNEDEQNIICGLLNELGCQSYEKDVEKEKIERQICKNQQIDENITIIDTDDKEVPLAGNDLYTSRENVYNNLIDNDAKIATIIVQGYNRLEKTKYCVECVLKYTKDINYELVLIDNGSNDGTFEYFKSVEYKDKKIFRITKNVGAGFSIFKLGFERFIGKYIVILPNDVYVTSNWLTNLLRCMESNNKIGLVMPMSSNISNLQDPGLIFNSLEEMQQKAKAFNRSDSSKWEKRLRLVNVISVFKREILDLVGKFDSGFFHDFGEDDYCIRLRRMGYELILCGDTFIHHDHDFRNLEDKDPLIYNKSLEIGRENYKNKYYGLDAWDDVINFERSLIEMITRPENKSEQLKILGIDVRCGTPILEIENFLTKHNINNILTSAFTADAKYYLDLQTVCNADVWCDRIDYLNEHIIDNNYDYIILGEPINKYVQPIKLLDKVMRAAKKGSIILFKLKNHNDINKLLEIFGGKKLKNRERYISIELEEILEYLNSMKNLDVKISAEMYNVDENSIAKLRNSIEVIRLNDSSDNALQTILTKEYLICVEKS